MSRRILLVEDEENNRVLMTDLLEKILGQQVLTAVDGVEAISVARSERPDLILMDLKLPRLDGWEATRALKSSEECGHIPIVAVTAQAMVGDREYALEVGFDGFFSKPIDVDEFIAFLQPYLEEGGEVR